MANSSEKVSFRVDMQCSSLRAEAFLVFEKGSQPTLGQQITDMRPTVGPQFFGGAVLHFFPYVGITLGLSWEFYKSQFHPSLVRYWEMVPIIPSLDFSLGVM